MKLRIKHEWDYFTNSMRYFVWEVDKDGSDAHIIASDDALDKAKRKATTILMQKQETKVVEEFEI